MAPIGSRLRRHAGAVAVGHVGFVGAELGSNMPHQEIVRRAAPIADEYTGEEQQKRAME